VNVNNIERGAQEPVLPFFFLRRFLMPSWGNHPVFLMESRED